MIASGSEVALFVEAHGVLAEQGIRSRVVSLPSFELFDAQDAEYRESVLPSSVRTRLAVEAGCTLGWQKYTGLDGDVIGLDGFGASAPAAHLAEHFGFTAENVVARAKALVNGDQHD